MPLVGVIIEESKTTYPDPLLMTKKYDCALLLHGILMGSWHMRLIERSLIAEGYDVTNISYPSRNYFIEDLAENFIAPEMPVCAGKTHIVAHSMGGLITRQLLIDHTPERMGKIIMIGTPNHGSELPDYFLEHKYLSGFYKFLFGPAGEQLRVKDNSFLARLPIPDETIGVIAGRGSLDFIPNWLSLPQPNDYKVSVASTKLDNMADHIVLPVSHTWLPINHLVRKQVVYFLENGKFDK